MAKRKRGAFDILALTSLMFFASGSTGLAYEVIWSKRFTHIWGSSTLAMASVVASFLFGLGLGALVFGRFADRVRKPLLWYGVAEIVIGLLVLAIPLEIVALSELAIRIHPLLPEVESIRFLVRCGLTFLVIGPPCILMGGTLPLLIRQFTPRDGELGAVVGWLYAINTFGAAFGCALAGFYLLPAWGLMTTNYATAALNLLIGGVSIALSLSVAHRLALFSEPRASEVETSGTPVQSRVPTPNASGWGVYLAVALTGLAALVLQMVWVRQLSLVLGGSTYSFTATLFVVLVAIAIGSLVHQFVLRRFLESVYLPIGVITVLAVATLIGTLSLPWLSDFASNYRETRWQWSVNALLCIFSAGVVQLVPGMAMGILFPMLVDLTRAAAAAVGRTVGNVYAWNTLGSIVGATFTSFYLIPWLGTIGSVALALALYFAAGLFLLPRWGERQHRWVWASYVAIAGALVGATGFYQSVANPLDTNFGLYLYSKQSRNEYLTTTFFREGASSNVLVISITNPKDPKQVSRSLRVNGKVDASTEVDMPTQLGLAVFPRFFNAQAKEVLVIGFGSGTTSGASLQFPGTRVTCCEIEPAVYEASSQFADVNHSPEKKTLAALEAENVKLPADKRLSPEQLQEQARFKIVFGDGRTALQTSEQKFDLIISEPSNPWLAGVSNLFTREFFAAAKAHLNDGGVLAQWIQTYNFTVAEYALIVRTMRESFPHAGVVVLSRGADTVLLASNKPLAPTTADLAELQKLIADSPALSADLQKHFNTTDARLLLLMHYYLDEKGLDRFVQRDTSPSGMEKVINTDLNMKLEFDAPLQLFSKKAVDVYPTILASSAPDWTTSLAVSLGSDATKPRFYQDLATVAASRQQLPQAAEYLQRILEIAPHEVSVYQDLGVTYEQMKKYPQALDAYLEWARRAPQEVVPRLKAAGLLSMQHRTAEAVAQYREALKVDPKLPLAANNLAWILATNPQAELRDGREAVRLAKIACEGAKNEQCGFLDTLAAAYAESGDYPQAIATLKAAVVAARKQNDTHFVAAASGRMKLYEQGKPFREG